MLSRRKTRELSLVVHTRVTMYPGPWTQLDITLIERTGVNNFSVSTDTFYDTWLVIETGR